MFPLRLQPQLYQPADGFGFGRDWPLLRAPGFDQDTHYAKMEDLVKQMWATPAQTPEGRRAKVLVALNMLPGRWRVTDEEADYGICETRQLLIEFVGGEPGRMLRDQFGPPLTTAGI